MEQPKIHLIDARRAEQQQLGDLRMIAGYAFREAMPHRSQEEIDRYTGKTDDAWYYKHMNDPNALVGNRLRANQQFWLPKIAIAAYEDGKPVGFAYAADNTSGRNHSVRWLKHQTNNYDYLWLRSIAVHPSYQNHGIGKLLLTSLLETTSDKRPVTAYVYPHETPGIKENLEYLGFVETSHETAHPFGRDHEPTVQVRMEAPSVGGVLDILNP